MKFNLTHNNHLQFGWGDGHFNFNDKNKAKFWITIGKSKYFPKSFVEECNRAAELIVEDISRPILVFFSGGIDSEVLLRSLISINAKFETCILEIKFKNQVVNMHDVNFAYEFCQEYNVDYVTVSISIEDILDEYQKIAHTYQTYNIIGVVLQHKLLELFPTYHTIYGGGDIKLERYKKIGVAKCGLFWHADPFISHAAEIADNLNTSTTDKFFLYTPELMLSWITDPYVAHWIKYEKSMYTKEGVINHTGIKAFVLYKHFPDMKIRPKLNGLETVNFEDPIFDNWRELKKIYSLNNPNRVYISYEDFYNMLKPATVQEV